MTEQLDLLDLIDELATAAPPADDAEAWIAMVLDFYGHDPHTHSRLPEGTEWCGRCGQRIRAVQVHGGHDAGYRGCPAAISSDRTWRWWPLRTDGLGTGAHATTHPTGILTSDELCDRYDANLAPRCAHCGHPFGVHVTRYAQACIDPSRRCATYCGCPGYTPNPST